MKFRNQTKFWLRLPLWLRMLSPLALLAVLGLLVAFSVPFAQKLLRDSRAKRNMEQAREATAQGRHQQARAAAMAVVLAGRDDPEAKQLLLKAMDELRDPRVVEVAAMIMAAPEQKREDRLHAWRICCREAAMGLVMHSSQWLLEDDRDDSDFRLPLADRMISERLFPEALRIINPDGDAEPPADLPIEWEERLVRLLISMGTADGARAAQERVVLRLANNPQEAEALLPLTDEIPITKLISTFHDALQTAAANNPNEGTEARLRRMRAEAAVWMHREDELIAKLFAEPADPLTLARWALRCNRPLHAAELITAEMAAEDAEAFLLRVEALRKSAQWQECRATLEAPPFGVVEAEVQTELAAVCGMLGDRTAFNQASDQALIIARLASETQSMIRLAKFAEERGMAAIARRAWVEAAKRRTGPMPLYSRLMPLISELDFEQREEDLVELVMAYRRLEPNNGLVLVHHHYIALLRGQLAPETAEANLKPLVENHPDFLPARMTLILAGLLSDAPATDLQGLVDASKAVWSNAPPSNRVLVGLTMAANGQHDAAQEMYATVRWERLLPAERRVYQGLRRQFNPDDKFELLEEPAPPLSDTQDPDPAAVPIH